MSAKRRAPRKWAALAAVLLVGAGARWIFASGHPWGLSPELREVVLRDPAPVPAVQLVNHRGQSVTSDGLFKGGWSFVFLGFTSCPNVCPATMSQLAAVKAGLAREFPGTPQPRYVFVSVDPQRDSPARLAAYVANFDRDFIGVTGEPGQLAALSDALTAFHRLEAPTPSGDYGVVHSGEIYLIDPAGRAYARFTPPLDTKLIPRQLVSLMKLAARESDRS